MAAAPKRKASRLNYTGAPNVPVLLQTVQKAKTIAIRAHSASHRSHEKTLEEAEMLPLRFFLSGMTPSIPKMLFLLKNPEKRTFACVSLCKAFPEAPRFSGNWGEFAEETLIFAFRQKIYYNCCNVLSFSQSNS